MFFAFLRNVESESAKFRFISKETSIDPDYSPFMLTGLVNQQKS